MSGSCLNNPFPACVRQVSLKDDFVFSSEMESKCSEVIPMSLKNRIPNKPC
ncbi:Uncharacterised protein [Raoultella ornithinolytica]|nr:Uncharacterised protein [Raoultella ornithinolytica]